MPRRRRRWAAPLVVAGALVAGACSSPDDTRSSSATPAPVEVEAGTARTFPPAPAAPTGPLHPDDELTIETMLGSLEVGFGSGVVSALEVHADPRVLWVLADFLRFTQGSTLGLTMERTVENIAGVDIADSRPWADLTDHLIAWDVPAPPGYPAFKGALLTAVDERWAFLFADPDATIDYRLLSWGGVLVDDRPLGDPDPCPRGCIPALDDPALVPATDGDWYPGDAVVFGVEIGGDAVAFPRNIMEVHEMVNATIGGRRIGMPYCTLCGSAQVFFTDEVAGVDRAPVLRTSGMLSRSNKVMYDLDSRSVFDTFTGAAVAGPLREQGVVLPQATVVTTTWDDWRTTHPDTRIVAEDGGIGRTYELDPLRGRDDDGPIFPVGHVDDRLAVQAQVLGVAVPGGGHVAFPVDTARATLQNGDQVEAAGITGELDGAGLRARAGDEPVPSHQAFWFAWSQFHPDTELWLPTP